MLRELGKGNWEKMLHFMYGGNEVSTVELWRSQCIWRKKFIELSESALNFHWQTHFFPFLYGMATATQIKSDFTPVRFLRIKKNTKGTLYTLSRLHRLHTKLDFWELKKILKVHCIHCLTILPCPQFLAMIWQPGFCMSRSVIYDFYFIFHVSIVTEKFSECMQIIANEPSLALFRIQEHIRKSLPKLAECKVSNIITRPYGCQVHYT